MKNEFSLLAKLFRKPAKVSTDSIVDLGKGGALHTLSKEERRLLQKTGITNHELQQIVQRELEVNYDRTIIYKEVDRAREHWMMSSALGLYADTASSVNSLLNRSVWVTSESLKYEKELTKMFDRVGIEEKIYDWAWSTALYGDLFPRINGQPGFGVIAIDDVDHPANMFRLDVNGVLIGFYDCGFGGGNGSGRKETEIIPPWKHIHLRILGAKRRRQQGNDPTYQEYRSVHLMSGDTRQASSNYGVSVLLDGIPVWKRLRLSEDSILLSRLTRGLLRYIYKVRVDSWEPESVGELIDEYVTLLKRARAINTGDDPNYDSKFGVMSSIEDLILPVWGEQGDVTIDKIGGDPDIRWITDVDKLENQLAMALRVPMALLGGEVADATGALGSEALTALDIQFSKTAKRLQRAMKEGITRLCQIHLAYMNLDPDPTLFEVHMAETSSAEEERLKETLDTGAEIIDKYLDMFSRMQEANPALKFDQIEFFTYMNQKILKLNDFDIHDFVTVEDVVEDIGEDSLAGSEPTDFEGGGMADMGTTDLETEEDLEEPGGAGGEGVEGMEALPANMAPPKKLPVERKISNIRAKQILSEYNKTKGEKELETKKMISNSDWTAALPMKQGGKLIMEQSVWESKYGKLKVSLNEKKDKKKK